MTITLASAFTSASLAPLSTLSVYDTSIACRKMIKAGIPKSVVAAHLFAQRGPGCVSLDYLEMRYGKMYGPRKTRKPVF